MKNSFATVTVRGPGRCFEHELGLIKKALRDAGYELEIEAFVVGPAPDLNTEVTDEWLNEQTQERLEKLSKGQKKIITLKVHHEPWGG